MKEIYLVFQEGGSSTELYWHSFDIAWSAKACREDAAKNSYRTSKVIETNIYVERLLSTCPMPLKDLLAHLRELVDIADEVGYP